MRRLLQFGTGRFLRGFVDAFIDDDRATSALAMPRPWPPGHRGGEHRLGDGPPSGGPGLSRITSWLRGLARAASSTRSARSGCIDRVDRRVHRQRRALVAGAASSRDLRSIVVSNATEAGYVPGPGGFPSAPRGRSWWQRARAGMSGPAHRCRWSWSSATATGCATSSRGRRRDVAWMRPAWAARPGRHHLGRDARGPHHDSTPDPSLPGVAGDPLAVAVGAVCRVGRGAAAGRAMRRCPTTRPSTGSADVGPFALREIRILNGAHTALVVGPAGAHYGSGARGHGRFGIRELARGRLLGGDRACPRRPHRRRGGLRAGRAGALPQPVPRPPTGGHRGPPRAASWGPPGTHPP